MAHTRALSYPWIDIQDGAWAKNALLYWDELLTIVPESIRVPYSTPISREMQDLGVLRPVRVSPTHRVVSGLADAVTRYLLTDQGMLVLSGRDSDRYARMQAERLPEEVRELVEMHPGKMSHSVRHMLHRSLEAGDEWIQVHPTFAQFYMTLLASELAGDLGVALLAQDPEHDSLAAVVRTGTGGATANDFGGRRLRTPRLAEGTLATLVMERIAIDPDTPLEQIIDFRRTHADELGAFRSAIAKLSSSATTDESVEALRASLADIYRNEVAPAVNNLKRSLTGCMISAASSGLTKATFFSVSGTSVPLALLGVSVPVALLIGAGCSLIAAAAVYEVDRREKLMASPYAYVVSAARELT